MAVEKVEVRRPVVVNIEKVEERRLAVVNFEKVEVRLFVVVNIETRLEPTLYLQTNQRSC